jgi:hypothetical protein
MGQVGRRSGNGSSPDLRSVLHAAVARLVERLAEELPRLVEEVLRRLLLG